MTSKQVPHRARLAGIVVAGCVALTGTFAVSAVQDAMRSHPALQRPSMDWRHRRVVRMDASWAHAYASVGELKHDSDAVVVGSVESAGAAYKREAGVPFTDSTVSVQTVVWDPGSSVTSGRVVVHQTGGFMNGQVFEVEDDPLLRPNEVVVLFLHEYSPGHFNVVGGPQGRFDVVGASVRAISSTHIPTLTEDVPLDQFIASIDKS